MRLAALNESNIKICLAERQIKGKGTQGKAWVSPYGVNIYLSLLWPFAKDISELMGLSLAVATIVVDGLTEFGIADNIGLRWPNDILWKNQKLAGILVETTSKMHHGGHVVIGIGLNVNMSRNIGKTIDQPWTTMRDILGYSVDRNKIAGLLINRLIKQLFVYQKQGFSAFIERWRQHDILLNKPVTIRIASNIVKGIARGINGKGHLQLEDTNGRLNIFSTGEVDLNILYREKEA